MNQNSKNQSRRVPGKGNERSQADERGGQAENRKGSGQPLPTPSFDEGGRKPSPIESSSNEGLRRAVPVNPAVPKGKTRSDAGKHTEGTMTPGEGQDPKRNTL